VWRFGKKRAERRRAWGESQDRILEMLVSSAPLSAILDAIAHAAYAGNPTDEAKNIKAFKDSLLPLRTGGQLSVAGYDVLSDAADAISATLP